MKKIAVVTATRAEYGILRPLIFRLKQEKGFRMQLVVTGMHLLEQYGNTRKEIEGDGLPIFLEIPILEPGNTPYDISVTMANAIRGFAQYFRDEKPDLLIVLGDRTELLGICAAALNEGVPIAHLHGGERTEGVVDDCIRHAVTKMSYLHFAATEEYRKRIIQLGEEPDRVFQVGALGVENILHLPLLTHEEICRELGLSKEQRYVVVTFHPVTLEEDTAESQTRELLAAMEQKSEFFYLITKANADAGGARVNALLESMAAKCENMRLVSSLGVLRYLSAVKYSAFVLGNSSSGIIEAPALGTPTVNIGDRQRGRQLAETVISCAPVCGEIKEAMEKASQMEAKASLLYGDGNTSEKIVNIVKEFFSQDRIKRKKTFYDVEWQEK
ncbi:MAG: UDP-N-acetylglucosamine 2-epimerase [Clostridiales bacterium]|nr:UDP-N-acetylglucosamine 2-epimerase [Clostridiales bacterium]